MSQYIEFYIKGKNEYLPIGIFSRSNSIYRVMSESVNVPVYDKVVPLKVQHISLALKDATDEKLRFEKRIAELREEKALVATFNNSVEDKTTAIFNINEDIKSYEELVEEINAAIGYLTSLYDIIDAVRYMKDYDMDNYVYCGIECENPNGEEE